jgi:hypothetical protein
MPRQLETIMKYRILFAEKSLMVPLFLGILCLVMVAPKICANANSTNTSIPCGALNTYGLALATRVFDPAAKPPGFWYRGEDLEFLSQLGLNEIHEWALAQTSRTPMRALQQPGDELFATLYDLCFYAILELNEPEGVERVGAFEQFAFRWARRSSRHVFAPLAQWLGSEISEHPGKTGDMICWFIGRRDVRLQWHEPIEAAAFDLSMASDKLLSALGNSDATTRVAALTEIGERGGNGAMVAFFAGLGDGDPKVRFRAALILEELAERRWGSADLKQ